MILTTTDYVPGRDVRKVLGTVSIGKDIVAGLRQLVGGEITEYTEMCTEAREEALQRMKCEGEKLEADAIINVRFITAEIIQGAAEILAYGTAVKLA